MKAAIRWATKNSPAMNTLMVGILLAGLISLGALRREVFPEFELEIILVTVPYPGAGPDEIEDGICEKIEEAVRSIAGIKKQTSVAGEGAGYLVLEIETSVDDVDRLLNEVRSEIDRIPSFPELAEDPEVKQITFRAPAIRMGLIGPDGDESESLEAKLALRALGEEIRSELLQLPPAIPEDAGWFEKLGYRMRVAGKRTVISQANIIGSKPYQIDVEVSEETLRRYKMSLQEVARAIRRENIEIPGGVIKGSSQEFLLRGKNKHVNGPSLERLSVLKRKNTALSLGEIANVKDAFGDVAALTEVDGRPAVVVSVDRTSNEDLFAITHSVRKYVADKQDELPSGYELRVWGDASLDVNDRIDLLRRNGLQGLLLVFLVLAVFLELRLAFWVAMGIPIAVLGACAVLIYCDQTLNMLSMFAFLLALGIVVDDAIVIGENIYTHRKTTPNLEDAAVNGTREVIPSVLASVATTMVAFAPLLFVSGVMGKFIAVMPVAVIAMLAISLFESTFILPCHLAHGKVLLFDAFHWLFFPLRPIVWVFARINVWTAKGMDWVINNAYLPALGWSIRNPMIIISGALAVFILSFGLVRSGVTPFVFFPKLDTKQIAAKVRYPDGTPEHVTAALTKKLEETIVKVAESQSAPGTPLINTRYRNVGTLNGAGPMDRSSGGHVGTVEIEMVGPESRSITSAKMINLWREASPQLAEVTTFESQAMGPNAKPIEFKLLAKKKHWKELEQATADCKKKLDEYQGVYDVQDDSRPGKIEYQFRLKDSAERLGVSSADIAETVRSSFFGEEVMRLQRGRHEVKLMVRYPAENRHSEAALKRIRVRTDDGVERALSEVAEIDIERGYSEINRIDQLRSITVYADVDASQTNSGNVIRKFKEDFLDQYQEQHPNITVRWEGESEQQRDSMTSLFTGFLIAMLVMFVLLTLEFRSYFQPLIILATIPFGIVGAIWGHAFMHIPLTLFSLFGLVALAGVVVNDSIVLIDFINARIDEGVPLRQALLEAGRRRFRPVLMTSLTTIAGLIPLLLEKSLQAQVLVPMATSLSFGLMLATVMILFLVPVYYVVYARLVGRGAAPVVSE